MNTSKVRRFIEALPQIRVRLSIGRQHEMVSRVNPKRHVPCPPDKRFSESGMKPSWVASIYQVYQAAADQSSGLQPGTKFRYEIPSELIPRKYPALFAMALGDGGYEVQLLPLTCVVTTIGRQRSGWMLLTKL